MLGIAVFIRQDLEKESLSKRCFVFLMYLACFYPFIDSGIERGGLIINPLKVLTLAFFIINVRINRYFLKKRFWGINLFILVCVITAICSEHPFNSLASSYNYLLIIMLFFITIKASEHKEPDSLIGKIIIPIFIWIALFAFIQIFIDPQFTLRYSSRQAEGRLDLCFVDPQTAGTVCILLATYYFSKAIFTTKKSVLLWCLILVVIAGFTGSKSCLIGFGVSVILILWYAGVRPSIIFLSMIICGTIVFTYDIWSQLPVFERMKEMDDSLEGRRDFYWIKAIEIFHDNTFLGIGPGNFQDYNIEHHLGLIHYHTDGIQYASQPESGYLLVLDEFGILSVVPLALILSLFRIRNNSLVNCALIIPWMLSFISLANLSYGSVSFVLAIYIGAVFFTEHRQKNKKRNQTLKRHYIYNS